MKILKWFAVLLFLALPLMAQSSRPVVLTWNASPSSGITGYSVYACTVPTSGTSCTPSLTGTPLATVTGLTYTTTEPIQIAYGFSVIVNGPACTSSTPLTQPCGNSAPVTVSYVPVPPNVAGESNLVVVVP